MATTPLPEWVHVDQYTASVMLSEDRDLESAVRESERAGLPSIQVAPNQGKLLHILARAIGARRVLEIGTLGGYSTIWLGRALPAGGQLLSLELDPRHAEVARANIARAGLSDRVEVRVGPAVDTLAALERAGEAPFDFVFIDADKVSYPEYLAWAHRLSRVGALIAIDNVVRGGAVSDPASDDANVRAVRRMNELFQRSSTLSATTIQTVGVKGYDGFTLALVVAPAPASGPRLGSQ